VTSDKGLAGAFNSNLIKGAWKFVADHPSAQIRFELLGRKGRDHFRKRGAAIAGEHLNLAAKVPGGAVYEFRITYASGTGTASYMMRVAHQN